MHYVGNDGRSVVFTAEVGTPDNYGLGLEFPSKLINHEWQQQKFPEVRKMGQNQFATS